MAVLILQPSLNDVALFNAIRIAADTDAELLLAPGVHLTPKERLAPIRIGPNGLTIRSLDPDNRAVIRRPSHDVVPPDDHHGLFFIPAGPTAGELATMQWHEGFDAETHDPITFGVVVRGEVRFENLVVDCNMGEQLFETLDMTIPENKREHCCMLGFRGDHTTPEGAAGRVYAGFSLVSLSHLEMVNGGYADDIWISRGYFYPNIREVKVDHVDSHDRVSPKRSTICFSGLALRVSITNSDFYELGMEDATNTDYDELPRATPWFVKAQFNVNRVSMDRLDIAARGQVYTLQATAMKVRRSTRFYQAAGTIDHSELHVGAATEPKIERCPGLTFRDTTWTIDALDDGSVRGIRPHSRDGEECRLRFVRNKFIVPSATSGHIIFSEARRDDVGNRVHVWFIDCEFPETWGRDSDHVIADIEERGLWWFTTSSLDGRDIDVACPVKQTADNGVFRIVFPWPSF